MSRTNQNKTVIVKTVVEKPVEASKEVIDKGKKDLKDVNELLDKIDDVLEENAEEFVKNYVQKSGE